MIIASGIGSPHGLPSRQRELILTGELWAGADWCSDCTEGPAELLPAPPKPRVRASAKEALVAGGGEDTLRLSVRGKTEEGGRVFSESKPWEVTGGEEDISEGSITKEGKHKKITTQQPHEGE